MSGAYYNEHDPFKAAWLRELIVAGVIAPGDVDERSIEDVRPAELSGYTQCHFFAGIGVWSYALRRAGWPDDRKVWTGSCPCQPFSSAGKGTGFADERHLWPAWFHLIRERRPGVVLGEQVANADGLAWLDLVQTDLEGEDYAVGPVDLCAAGVGAPHRRQRDFFVGKRLADAGGERLQERIGVDGIRFEAMAGCTRKAFERGSDAGRMADLHGKGCEQGGERCEALGYGKTVESDLCAGRMAAADGLGRIGRKGCSFGRVADGEDARRIEGDDGLIGGNEAGIQRTGGAGPTNGLWRDADWLLCRDGKWRPVEPCAFPLAHGSAARVGRLRGYGDAINAEAARAFIETVIEELRV